jgi:hypothetical protein
MFGRTVAATMDGGMIGGFPEIKIETTQTLDTMLHQILNQALVAIGAKAGSQMLVDARQGILQIKARLGRAALRSGPGAGAPHREREHRRVGGPQSALVPLRRRRR